METRLKLQINESQTKEFKQIWRGILKEKDLIEYRGSKKSGGYFVKSREAKS